MAIQETKCMLSIDPKITKAIQEEGCEIYRKMPEAIEEIRTIVKSKEGGDETSAR